MLPVDKYVGGVEHATMHLLYARFITKALRDMGYLNFDEPFTSLVHQGIILGSDGQKMSKRNGAVSPDVYIDQYGSDVFRLYLGFGFSYRDGGPWNDDGIKAMARFVAKIGRIVERYINSRKQVQNEFTDRPDENLEYVRHFTIQQVTHDMDDFQFNTAIARIMELTNALIKYQADHKRCAEYEKAVIKDLLLLLAPLAPHFIEEMWETMGYKYSVHNQKWPKWDESKLLKNNISIAVQVNGKLREVICVSQGVEDEPLKEFVLNNPRIKELISHQEIRKVIIVKDRIVNIVI
mgnify:CR=1 FL=1